MARVLQATPVAGRPESDRDVSERIDRHRLLRELASQRVHCQGRSPFYVAVLAEIETEAAESPEWLDRLEAAWRERRFAVGWEAAHLLLANLHFAALSGEDDALAAAYPSCGGNGIPAGAVAAYLGRAPQAFWERLRGNHVQTNEVDRSVPWMVVGACAFGRRGIPYHFVELGASAGLNTVGDHVPHACRFEDAGGAECAPPAPWNGAPHDLLSRTGLDIRPRRVEDPVDRMWLKACVWADDAARLARLDGAVDAFLRMRGTPRGPILAHCDFESAPDWLRIHRRAHEGEGLLVFNSIGTIYLADDDYRELSRGMARALAPWGDRAVWVEYERARGASAGPLDIRVHRVIDGQLCTRVLGSGAPRPVTLQLRAGWEFVQGGDACA